ncbi:hypothetical protein C900_00124 [Fulvivirga imtechensis AK7]|uniref:Uncharacterized protein n=1 Tax=Fulvivirga imtechensis AK7 TaxID=1237149 RepID=L8JZF5_9BACT|nr:hypothetical protein C900_00124 [Fulvivirga imtechensis AK7]
MQLYLTALFHYFNLKPTNYEYQLPTNSISSRLAFYHFGAEALEA